MKILFVIRYPINTDYHLNTKYAGMVGAFRGYGHEVDILGQCESGFRLISQNHTENLDLPHDTMAKKLGSFGFYYRLFRYACTVLQSKEYDAVYIRKPALWFKLRKLTAIAAKKRTDVIVEIPTCPADEEIRRQKNMIKRTMLRMSSLYEKMNSNRIGLYVVIGENIHGRYNGRPAINISNAIDVAGKRIRTPKTSGDEMHMLALSAMTYWQGFDRVIEGMRNYTGKTKVFLHLVGDDCDGTLKKLLELGKTYGIGSQIIAHGALYGKALDDVFDLCDVGIGTLGMYRKGMVSASVLKVRDYMSRGLPFIHATDDSDLSNGAVGCMRVTNNNGPIDIEALITFTSECQKDGSCIENMRQYAMENMTWEKQAGYILERLYGVQ